MKKITSLFKYLYYGTRRRLIDLYNMLRRLRLKNKTPTIICNNCLGGIIYHDMGLQFNSPTINLWFTNEDFIKFAKNLDYYTHCDIEQIYDGVRKYPIGLMRRGEETVTVYFMHYGTFEKAVDKWRERVERINYDNLYCIFENAVSTDPNDEVCREFFELDYKNKMMITRIKSLKGNENACYLKLYEKDYITGDILSYKNDVSLKRKLDDFDYISFLNRK